MLRYLFLSFSVAFAWRKGVVFGGGEWSASGARFGTPTAQAALEALASTGADHVRILVTYYQTFINSTTIYPLISPTPLASESLEEVTTVIRAAHSLNLSVFLAPILDPSWDVVTNGRSIIPPANATPVSRLLIGSTFTELDWNAWFKSYAAFILPLATLAAAENVAMFEVASELDVSLTTRGSQWRSLISELKNVYNGSLFLAANADTLGNIDFWDALDAIGVDAYYGLGNEELPLGVAPTVAQLVAAWEPIRESLANLSSSLGKPVLFTEVGYQSRPSCHIRPWGTIVHDPTDDSAWLEDHDMACQANAYEALLRTFSGESWWGGVFWWLWRSDATAGGTGDSDFTPHGKPAEVVLKRWYGAPVAECGRGYGEAFLAPPSNGMALAWPEVIDAEDAQCDGSAAIVSAMRDFSPPLSVRSDVGSRRMYNGFVFGGPDQWSSPTYRFDSTGAFSSLAALAATGADTAEIIVQWYVTDVNSTVIYPVTDPANPLRTSTDAELTAILAEAARLNLKTILTLMLDPDWTLPSQNFCRGSFPVSDFNCHWRGEIGMYWGDACSPGSLWADFFTGYTQAVVHYAKLANATGVDAYLLSHELQRPTEVCPNLWADMLSAVRNVYNGKVSTAFNPDGPAVIPPSVTSSAWVQSLDFIGVDCYFTPPLPPWDGPGKLNPGDVHPPLPWQDLNLSTLLSAQLPLMVPFAALSKAVGGKPIVCTEVGWASRPWTYVDRAGTLRLDGEDCSVWDQCVSVNAQALAYEAFLQTYYAQPWFGGVTFWTWRADPTCGGASDDGFTPTGKGAAAVAKTFWGARK